MKIFLFILVTFMNEFAIAQTTLDGKTFVITLNVSGKERPGSKWTKDELSFNEGRFTSKFMGEREKFPPFEYSLVIDSTSDDVVTFTAEGSNPGGSTIIWKGKVTGSNIEGFATWTNMNGPQKEIFKGSIKEER